MQCYTELVPPTAVTHAVALPFLSADATNLVIAKTSLLQVFTVRRTPDNGERLLLIGEYNLAGTVTSLARVKILDSKSGGEAVLLAFKDAKLSLVEWDQENYRISTVSIHYYEADNVTTLPYGPTLAECHSILTVDPSSRCAALKFGQRQLAILPFRQVGDDLVGEEEGDFQNDTALKRTETNMQVNGEAEQTPYKASFVLPLTALDPALSHTVHLAFLYEYREPTFGILSSAVEPSYSMIEERKDVLTYTVFTLDLEQRASTNLITVAKLPATLWKVIPLPLPIGGALLVGTNELVHVDQSGKANATAVNEFAKLESDFGMADQSHLNLKLEDCSIDILDAKTGQLLIVTREGALATLTFQMLGRSIGSLNVAKVEVDSGGGIVQAAPSCITRVDSGKLFVGSEDGDSTFLGWTKPTLNRKRSHAQMVGKDTDADDEDEDAIEEDDDDLYDAAPEVKKRAISDTAVGGLDIPFSFTVNDTLPGLGPINEACLGRSGSGKQHLELAAGTGRKQSGRFTIMNRDIVPRKMRATHFADAKGAWAIRGKGESYDNLLFVHDGENTKIYDISHDASEDAYVERNAPEFESEGATVDVGTLADGAHIVHCRRADLVTYDPRLGLNQIIPMVDDETEAEFNIVHVSFCDPYVLVIRDDSSVVVLSVQGKEIEPLEGEGPVTEKKWLSGCIYNGELTGDNPALFLLSADGGLHVFNLPDLQPAFHLPTPPHLPPVLAPDATQRRAGTKETLVELLVADIGQSGATQPYLILRTALDDIVLYEPFQYPAVAKGDSWHTNMRFRKVPLTYIPKYNEVIAEAQGDSRPPPLKAMRIGDYRVVTIPGAPACLLVRESSSPPKVLELREPEGAPKLTAIASLHRTGCGYGFLVINEKQELQENQLPESTWYGTGWSIHQVDLGGTGRDVRHVAYHDARGLYIVAACRDVDFYFAEEDGRHPEQDGKSQASFYRTPSSITFSLCS